MAIAGTIEWRQNISRAKKGKVPYVASLATRRLFALTKVGQKNPNWRGGVTPEHKAARMSAAYRQWRMRVFKRDNYTCIHCGDSKGGNLEADHIKPFALFPKLRYRVTNGRTLCIPCHRKTPTWGRRFPHQRIYN